MTCLVRTCRAIISLAKEALVAVDLAAAAAALSMPETCRIFFDFAPLHGLMRPELLKLGLYVAYFVTV